MRIITLVVALSAPLAFGDVVHMQDGSTLQGDVKRGADGWTVIVDGKPVFVKTEDVKSIDVGGSAMKSDEADLASLRRSVAGMSDPKTAIDRYTRYIGTAKGAAAEAAKADLIIWQDRLDRGLVKYAGQWLSPTDAADAKAKAIGKLSEARDKMASGDLKGARAIVDAAVAASDPPDPAAAYFKGLMAFNEGDIPTARKSFDAAVAGTSNHAPSLNNLAVVMMRQNQIPAAMNLYIRAMQAAPNDPRILDNVAEALNSSSDDAKLAAAVKKTVAVFSPLDMAMAKQMASHGYFRWGATWVSQAEFDQLQAMEKKINDELAGYEQEYKTTQDKVRKLETEIEANTRVMKRLEATSYFRDETGRTIRLQLPASYYEMQRDNEDLGAERATHLQHIDELRATAKRAKAQLPKPRYTGAQRLIGPDDAPGFIPKASPLTEEQPAGQQPLTPTATTTTAQQVPPNPGPPPRAQTP
jgi:Tfp pilus assembly protein PilF